MHYQEVAKAILSEVGLRLADVVPLPRRGRGLARYRGHIHSEMATGEQIIRVTLPIDCEVMLHILAHEVGHFHYRHVFTSIKPYICEYQAELYANDAFARHGIKLHPFLVASGKRYVRHHCRMREAVMGETLRGDPNAWVTEIIQWCDFKPKFGGFHE